MLDIPTKAWTPYNLPMLRCSVHIGKDYIMKGFVLPVIHFLAHGLSDFSPDRMC